MKLLIDSKELESEFYRLLNSYSNYYWATAWAGSNFSCNNELRGKKQNIRKIIVGFHFFQTHPDFIEEYIVNVNVKFIKQTNGVFHPKIYLFQNEVNDWELLIGSANFTKSAFSINSEATILLSNNDENSKEIYKKSIKLINQIWIQADYFSREEFEGYKSTWKNQNNKIRSLSGDYGADNKKNTPIFNIEIIKMHWSKYIERLNSNDMNDIKKRINLLKIVREYFQSYDHFNNMNLDERRAIAGTIGIKNEIDWRWFGSMRNGNFQHRIKENDENISFALDQIPLNGNITKSHYESFIKLFNKSIPDQNMIASASRLLSMKRPDVFVCLNNKNMKNLCKEFNIIKKDMTYERYWNEIIMRILDSFWWNEPEPMNEFESEINKSRSAFLDVLYYES